MAEKDVFPLIRTRRLLLKLPPPSMAAQVTAYVDANREHHEPWSPAFPENYFTQKYWRERLRAARQEFLRGESLRLFFFRKNDEEERVVGSCNFSNIIRGPFQACFLGYMLDKDSVGQGLMQEALSAAIRYVFDEMRLHRIMANYMPRNERSGRVLRRLGFNVEGYARDYLLIAGRWEDHILTALVKKQSAISEDKKLKAES